MIIFVQNYKKIVDSSIISILVAVFVGFVITMAEKWINKSGSADSTTSQRPQARPQRPAPQQVRREPQAAQPATRPKQARKQRPKPEHQPQAQAQATPVFDAAAEGQRVTTDAPAQPRRKAAAAHGHLPPMPGGNLRSAIIWSEILRRKF